MSKNKKIRNATSTKIRGITFKSQTEKLIYKTLLENNIKPEYEAHTFVLWDGFSPITPFYDQETDKQHEKRCELEGKKSSKILVPKIDKVVGIRYTPDFHFIKDDIHIWIEVKGIENDVFYIKKKMFRKFLDTQFENTGVKSMFFEIYTKKQMLQALQIIEDYAQSIKNN